MNYLLECIQEATSEAFEKASYDKQYARISLSNRPDLCEYQCNGAMAAAKAYKKNPLAIAEEIAAILKEDALFESVEAVKPGFINMNIAGDKLTDIVCEQASQPHLGLRSVAHPRTVMVDYGGPNVAKPLHVGHLRAAVIGESIKRLLRFTGENVIGDVHMGDFGLQMGLIITELHERQPDLVYFDETYTGEYPSEAPFTLTDLEEIYPTASAKSKKEGNESYKEAAMRATLELQQGRPGYRALLAHIIDISVTDLKKNYERLHVSFDLWKGESDAAPYIHDMVEKMKADGYAYISEDALVVDVAEPEDAKEIPPCIILKSDGAALYNTTDLATLVYRRKEYDPDEIIYVVDKRQGMYFTQVFRCAKKVGIVKEETKLTFQGFGTVNGKDGTALKTRDGGVMRLSSMLDDVKAIMLEKIADNDAIDASLREQTAEQIALSAIKYGDLSNQPVKDYIFDENRFSSFEGNTGPYILYTMVRIKSILRKYYGIEELPGNGAGTLRAPLEANEKALYLLIARFPTMIEDACAELSPNRVCAYIYEMSNAFNAFYHNTKILSCASQERKESYIKLLEILLDVLETCIDLLGFEAPDRM